MILKVSKVFYSQSFKGMPQYAPTRKIYDANDAICQYEVLKHPKYTEIVQEEESFSKGEREKAKQIREHNYAFLDCLQSDIEKSKFIEYFKKLTGFPILKASTKKMLEEFERVLNVADKKMNYARQYQYSSDKKSGILMSGYDEFCSAGQMTALPGSDLDKSYAVVVGPNDYYMSDKEFSDRFKGHIWENIDNRILSVNHPAAFPNIITLNELVTSLEKADKYAENFTTVEKIPKFWVLKSLPHNLYTGARFNIFLSDQISNEEDRNEIKNLAYIVEAIRDGKKLKDISLDTELGGKLFSALQNSFFSRFSNVIQSKSMQEKFCYSKHALKDKLKARIEMESQFDKLPVKEQYAVVKEVIRSMSEDSENPEYIKMFACKPDKYRLLLNDILRGKVSCIIDDYSNIFLFFGDKESEEQYSDVNVYNAN